jgi:hypothetical protein
LVRLRKLGVKLDEHGELDLTDVELKNERNYILKNSSIAKLTLMQSDLEFEYPQKLEKMQIRADVIEMANKEEEKLQFAEFAKEAEEARKKVLTYEEYFGIDPAEDGHVAEKQTTREKQGKGTYEQFVE